MDPFNNNENNSGANPSQDQGVQNDSQQSWSSHNVNTHVDHKSNFTRQEADNPRDTFNVNYNCAAPSGGGPSGPNKNKKTGKVIALILVAVFVLSGIIGGSVFVGYQLSANLGQRMEDINGNLAKEQPVDLTGKADIVSSQNTLLSVPEIAKKVAPSVVAITTKMQVQTSFMPTTTEGAGSGFVFAENDEVYYIATNNHVIENASEATVSIKGESIQAYLQGRDSVTDLAVIYIKKSDIPATLANYLKVADIGSSKELVVGELAVAIGNPLGLGESVSAGIVSALDRKVVTDSKEFTLIQTDAAINPGNSGGALVNGKGEIVGINTLKVGKSDVEGIGFAIPMNSAKPILEEIISSGSIQRPYIGIYGTDMTNELASAYGLPLGVFIQGVTEGGPAERAGIKAYDVLIAVDNQKVMNMAELKEYISGKQVGDQVNITLIRDGKQKKTTVTIEGK